jgi:hypothetical protein
MPRIVIDVGDDPGPEERDLLDSVEDDQEITVYVWRPARSVASTLQLPASVEDAP